ncbi:MAG: hypothetical protein KDI71_04750, partial [Xanthomonadales bacterium]|nr:hypothetical protein [Xanthomonadales bacterium]
GGGTGTGTVSGPGISCTINAGGGSGDCTEAYTAGTNVTLTASATGGSTFTGWSGSCSGASPTCNLTMSQARTATASFNAPSASSIFDNGFEDGLPPTISDVADQAIDEDTATVALAFTVSDPDTPPANLQVTATSSNVGLVPNLPQNLVLAGSGSNRSITVIPVQDGVGVATITLTVSDGGTSAMQSFVLTVNQVNDPPSFVRGPDLLFTPDVQASGAVIASPNPWATSISPCPANRPTCAGNEANQIVSLSAANVSDPSGVLAGTGNNKIVFTDGTMSFTFADDPANPGFAPPGVVCFDVVATDNGTPSQSVWVFDVKVEVGNGNGTCGFLVNENFDDGLIPAGFTVFGGSVVPVDGKLRLSSACLELPAVYNRNQGLYLEVDFRFSGGDPMQNADFNIYNLYTAINSCALGPTNGYNVGLYPDGGDNTMDVFYSIISGNPTLLTQRNTSIPLQSWRRLRLETRTDGTLRVLINSGLHMEVINLDHALGKIALRSFFDVEIDNLVLGILP